ncbi:hypothetical protein VTH06DRAFT_6405 [Thermothelomyces fergusii]
MSINPNDSLNVPLLEVRLYV